MFTKRCDADRRGGVEHRERAPDVGLERFHRMRLEQRQVLERRGVEDDVGPVLVEQSRHTVAVADVEQHEIVGVEERAPLERQLHRVRAPTRRGRS